MHQIAGIPMGCNTSPALANVYLYFYEYTKLLTLKQQKRLDEARACAFTFRYLDDTLSIDNPIWEQLISKPAKIIESFNTRTNEMTYQSTEGLYPAALQLNNTTITPDHVQFIGTDIRNDGNGLKIGPYDKRKAFPFIVNRFPNANSLIPKNIGYGVFNSILYRHRFICNRYRTFIFNCAESLLTFQRKNWDEKRLRTQFRSFSREHAVTKYQHSITKMMRDLNSELRELKKLQIQPDSNTTTTINTNVETGVETD